VFLTQNDCLFRVKKIVCSKYLRCDKHLANQTRKVLKFACGTSYEKCAVVVILRLHQ